VTKLSLEQLRKNRDFHKEEARRHTRLSEIAAEELQRECPHLDPEVVWVDRLYISSDCHLAMCTQCGKEWSLCGPDQDEKAQKYKEVGLLQFKCLESSHR
jgi:hypothetical protein